MLDFARAASELGFDWLGEMFKREDEEGEEEDEEGGTRSDGMRREDVLFVAMPTDESLRALLRLWDAFTRKEPARERGKWWTLFGYLTDIRSWSPRDRIEKETVDYIRRVVARASTAPVRLELDLWFRGEEAVRHAAQEIVRAAVEAIGGTIVDDFELAEIRYAALLVDLPPHEALRVAEREGRIAILSPLKEVRPQSIYHAEADRGEPREVQRFGLVPPDARSPIVAILDGHVTDGHVLLAGHVDVMPLDVPGSEAPTRGRVHGTAMASLILYGDLGADSDHLGRRIAIVPVMRGSANGEAETTPPDMLALKVIWRAVVMLKEGLGGSAPAAPDVVLINHSICDETASFVRRPSSWARLLDHLSFKYGVLFIVSTGNCKDPFPVAEIADWQAFVQAAPIPRQNTVIKAVERHKEARRLLSPAEAVNVMTVGAVHADASGDPQPPLIDPYHLSGLTSLCSRVGPGANGSLKPDLVTDGGRQVAGNGGAVGSLAIWGRPVPQVGQEVAAPDPGGNLRRTDLLSGTSNAAALATRALVRLADTLNEALIPAGIDWLRRPTRAVMLKALAAHACRWGEVGIALDAAYPPQTRNGAARRAKTIGRFLGNGSFDSDLVMEGSQHRVTLLAEDEIWPDKLHEYKIPIPVELVGFRDLRRLVLTLAWCSPVDGDLNNYRRAALRIVDGDGKTNFWDRVSLARQPSHHAQRRGTLIHRVLEGRVRINSVPNGGLVLGVQAMPMRGEACAIPYALAVTLEVAATLQADVYNLVSTQVRQSARARIPARVRS